MKTLTLSLLSLLVSAIASSKANAVDSGFWTDVSAQYQIVKSCGVDVAMHIKKAGEMSAQAFVKLSPECRKVLGPALESLGLLKGKFSNSVGYFYSEVTEYQYKDLANFQRLVNAGPEEWLAPTTRVQSTNPEIMKLAAEITKGLKTDREKARAIHDWVRKNIKFDWDYVDVVSENMFSEKRMFRSTAVDTLKTKKGVCFEMVLLNMALLRANKIPAKMIVGTIKPAVNTNHVWAEAYFEGRWVTLDVTNNYFDPNPEYFEEGHRRVYVHVFH